MKNKFRVFAQIPVTTEMLRNKDFGSLHVRQVHEMAYSALQSKAAERDRRVFGLLELAHSDEAGEITVLTFEANTEPIPRG